MTLRKPKPVLLYSGAVSGGWARALNSLIDEGFAALLCRRQWQQAPLVITRQPTSYSTDTRFELAR
jgi:hypothetical protein